jgi:hypothetical protein
MLRTLFAAVLLLAASGCGLISSSSPTDTNTSAAPAPTARPDEVSFELTEDQLTERLNQRLAGQSLGQTPLGTATLQRIEAEVQNGQVLANGAAAVAGQTVPVTLAGHVDLQGGKPIVVVSDANAAGVPLPQSARDAARGAIQDQVDQEVSRLNMQVRSISMVNGKLTLIGTRAR